MVAAGYLAVSTLASAIALSLRVSSGEAQVAAPLLVELLLPVSHRSIALAFVGIVTRLVTINTRNTQLPNADTMDFFFWFEKKGGSSAPSEPPPPLGYVPGPVLVVCDGVTGAADQCFKRAAEGGSIGCPVKTSHRGGGGGDSAEQWQSQLQYCIYYYPGQKNCLPSTCQLQLPNGFCRPGGKPTDVPTRTTSW